MAEEDTGQEKTEEATPRRLERAREEGQVPRSRELSTAAILLAGSASLFAFGNVLGSGLLGIGRNAFRFDRAALQAPDAMLLELGAASSSALWMLAPVSVLLLLAAVLGPAALGGWIFSARALAPKLERLDPVRGLERMFSLRSLVELLKAIGKGMSPNQHWLIRLQKTAAAAKEAAAAAAAAAAGNLVMTPAVEPVAPAAPVTAAQAYSPLRDINPIKRRLLEIYFNAIEFGPYLYGIGKASRHYFGKSAKDLTPREAAWFSSILPNPKRRYIHYCKGAPDEKWEKYIDRIVRRNHERGRLTDEEFAIAMQDRLIFDRAEMLPEKECLALIQRLTELPPLLPAAMAPGPNGEPVAQPLSPPPPPLKLPPPPPWAEAEVHTVKSRPASP